MTAMPAVPPPPPVAPPPPPPLPSRRHRLRALVASIARIPTTVEFSLTDESVLIRSRHQVMRWCLQWMRLCWFILMVFIWIVVTFDARSGHLGFIAEIVIDLFVGLVTGGGFGMLQRIGVVMDRNRDSELDLLVQHNRDDLEREAKLKETLAMLAFSEESARTLQSLLQAREDLPARLAEEQALLESLKAQLRRLRGE